MGVRILNVSNISPIVTKEQIQTLFSYIGRIEEFKLFPSDFPLTQTSTPPKFAFVKYKDERSVEVGQHLTNTVFLDRALVCIPWKSNKIPDEETAAQSGSLALPGQRQLPPHISNQLQDLGEGQKMVMYLRMATGNDQLPCDYAYIEFSQQSSVPLALQNSDSLEFQGRVLRIQHSKVAIIKPQRKTAEQSLEEVEEAIRGGAVASTGEIRLEVLVAEVRDVRDVVPVLEGEAVADVEVVRLEGDAHLQKRRKGEVKHRKIKKKKRKLRKRYLLMNYNLLVQIQVGKDCMDDGRLFDSALGGMMIALILILAWHIIRLCRRKPKPVKNQQQTSPITNNINSVRVKHMEGILSKWTNVMHGWQHRYFVLNDDVLCYYTSKEKMARGQQRGCIRLRGAALGIDEENDTLFTVAVDGKTFHLQGKNKYERNSWVRALERVIHEKCGYYKPPQEDPIVDLHKRVTTAENQSQMLLEQTRNLEQQLNKESEKADHKRKKILAEILMTAKRLQSTVDHSLILLQQVQRDLGYDQKQKQELIEGGTNGQEDETKEEITLDDVNQIVSFSSSDDEFFDAKNEEGSIRSKNLQETEKLGATEGRPITTSGSSHRPSKGRRLSQISPKRSSLEDGKEPSEPDWTGGDEKCENYDAIYNNTDEHDVGDINKQHGSVLMHLLSQVSIGMDLSKVTLPTFILERRSLLEMYSEFFAHPDDFISAVNLNNPESRFLAVVEYYLNSFYPARKSGVAKKPFNPILGEIFRCRWTLPGTMPNDQKTQKGPFPGSGTNQVTFIAEQVSHHPPISAFYAEHPEAGVSCTGYIYTKSSFLGLSIGVHHIGNGTVILHNYGEQYVVTFPSAYGRSIMSTPWIELGGKVEIHCEKTQYRAEIEFLTKPIFRGKPHQIQGNIYFGYASKKPIIHLKGEWNSQIYMRKGDGGDYQLFTDVLAKDDVNKECIPVMKQEERESRRLWRHVTLALFRDNIEIASQAKRWIEQRQREEKIKRDEKGIKWKTRFFEKVGDSWRYKESLGDRINDNL
ncbi:Oxysterol-binding protein [Meloidogyne graminicola]|uniref:Oxysterol-binding protein n=1 Tax=Meloidogyne graminicola TaxID=189291 RepID=A0A8S9ZWW5_9BILA|nr:Oxysterol-binding protein [Meloidogyne graminicola]